MVEADEVALVLLVEHGAVEPGACLTWAVDGVCGSGRGGFNDAYETGARSACVSGSLAAAFGERMKSAGRLTGSRAIGR
jgi:hypothetical protein